MNISSVLGIFSAVAVFLIAIITSSADLKVFLNVHALLIVIGGTFAAAMISFPVDQLWKLQRVLFSKVLFQYGILPKDLISQIVKLAELNRNEPGNLASHLEAIQYPFLKEALTLQLEGTIPADKLEALLRKRAEVIFITHEAEAHIFKSISRFPPAFGLLGAVMGMISLLQGLGSPDSFKQIGPAMAMSMVATMYGIAVANFIFIPLGENLSKLNKKDYLNRNIVIDGARLIQAGEHPIVVEENLNSYLLPADRADTRANAA